MGCRLALSHGYFPRLLCLQERLALSPLVPDPMYCILLEFRPLDGKEKEFIHAWKALTEHIYQNYGSRGSRLHRSDSGKLIAYAQWPDKAVYENVTSDAEGARLRDAMLKYLKEDGIIVLEKLEVLEDLLA